MNLSMKSKQCGSPKENGSLETASASFTGTSRRLLVRDGSEHLTSKISLGTIDLSLDCQSTITIRGPCEKRHAKTHHPCPMQIRCPQTKNYRSSLWPLATTLLAASALTHYTRTPLLALSGGPIRRHN